MAQKKTRKLSKNTRKQVHCLLRELRLGQITPEDEDLIVAFEKIGRKPKEVEREA